LKAAARTATLSVITAALVAAAAVLPPLAEYN
jgi:hypothetical protein